MVSLKNKQSGFTIVELLIVIVIIGILAGLVITTFVGIQQRARNSERQTDINSVSSQLEGYFAKNSGYPTLADITDVTGTEWAVANEVKFGDNRKALDDPSGGTTTLVGTVPTAVGAYSYTTTPGGCVSPTDETGAPNTGTFCTGYTLTAFQEGGQPAYTKNSAN